MLLHERSASLQTDEKLQKFIKGALLNFFKNGLIFFKKQFPVIPNYLIIIILIKELLLLT